jgi:guanine deaminase
MKWMIKGATVMTLDNEDKWLENGDIVVDKGRIIAVGQDLSPESFGVEKILEGRDKLAIPGLVNAHLHSHDRFDKGRLDNLPLEVWMTLYNPPFTQRNWTPRECYLRTIINCMEMLKTGTTTVIDDVSHGIPFSEDNAEAVFQAYQDIGMRALVSLYYHDKPLSKTIPYLEDLLPDNIKEELAQLPAMAPGEMIERWRDFSKRWCGRVGFVLSPAAPQRCSDEFLKETRNLSMELNLPVIIHVLETRVQAVTGQLFYGKTIVEHINSLGILTPKTTLIHGVWLSDHDIELIGDAGASIVHNPVSNLKLGSGIAPVGKMLSAGINVGIGTDNNSANDGVSVLEAMKMAALLHKVSGFDYRQWVGAKDAVRMATRGGAGCGSLQENIGHLSVGMKADMVLLDLKKLPFLPHNDLLNQLVFCEQGWSVDTVIIDGIPVVEDGIVTTVNEQEILDEFLEREQEIREKIRIATVRGGEIEPYLRQAYFKCAENEVGFSRYCGS